MSHRRRVKFYVLAISKPEVVLAALAIYPFIGIQKGLFQFFVIVCHRKLWKLVNDVLRRGEQNARIGFAQHAGVIVRITGSDNFIVQAVKGFYGFTLLVGLAQAVIGNALINYFKFVTK